jgi:predicted phage baseplate assembly protein
VIEACGCCTVPVAGVPVDTVNRSGLPAIAYRVGTFGAFRHAILSRIASTPELAGLRTRASDDYTVATAELWAAVADVLAFYHERTANEGFLRTASLRDSVLRLVRLLGYELRPGSAATTFLAFAAERGKTARILPGTRVKSVPLHDEPAQTFETVEALEADSAWNLLTPERTRAHAFQAGDTGADFDLTAGLVPGDVIVFAGAAKFGDPTSTHWDAVRAQLVRVDVAARRMRVTWTPALGAAGRPFPSDARPFALRQRAAVFGHNAADWHLLSDVAKAALLGLASPDDLTDADRLEWPHFDIYAPDTSGGPQSPASVGTMTIQPTAQSVASAVTAAAKSANQTLIAEATNAGMAVMTLAGQASSVLGQVTAGLSLTGSEVTRRAFEVFGKYATDALTVLTSLQALATDVLDRRNDLDAFFNFDPANPPIIGNALTNASDQLMAAATALQAGILDAAGKLLGFPAKALDELKADFAPAPTPGPITQRLTQLATLVGDLVTLAGQMTAAAATTTQKAASAVGAMATDQLVQLVVHTVMDARDPLPEATPELVAMAARLAVGIAEMVISQDAALAGAAGGAAIVGIAGPAVLAGLAVSPALAVIGATVIATVAPVTAGAAAAAFLLGPAAHEGATRVAGDVRAAAAVAVQPQIRPNPARFQLHPTRDDTIDLDAVYPRVVEGGWLLLSRPGLEELYALAAVQQTTRTDFALTGAVTRVTLRGNNLDRDPATGRSRFGLRDTVAFVLSEELTLAPDVITTPVTGGQITVAEALPLPAPARRLLVVGTDVSGDPVSELVTLVTATADPSGTALVVTPALAHHYRRDGVAIHGNVAFATHGETVRPEIVGDGDASVAFQRVALAKKPVTYVPGGGADGVESTLRLLVNGVRWREVPTLYGTGPRDEVFIARIADDATLTVQTGDGLTGARLPSGRANVVASYRTGIGVAGRVRAGGLTTLLDRPTGLKSVTNPLGADGGADPETLAHARESAPGTVRTFGRAVSLRDVEDIALASGEVARASASWVWAGERRAIHLTVAAQGGEGFSPQGLQRIREALDARRDPNHRLLLANVVRLPIVVSALLAVSPDRVNEAVRAAARAALLDALSFEALGFAQPVHLSDLFAVLQAVPGVVAVDIDDLDFKDPAVRASHGAGGPPPQAHLRLLPARPAGGVVLPAEQARIEDPDGDVDLRASGGLPT